MKIPLSKVYQDYLALRGESPDLLPELEDNEWSAVLTIRDEVRVKLLALATKATLETPPLMLDELRSADVSLLVGQGNYAIARMPPDYLRLHSLRMADWAEPLRSPEPPDSLRAALGSNSPGWMFCPRHPMVTEESDTEGVFLKIYGSRMLDRPSQLIYVPIPTIDHDQLVISRAAYHKMLLYKNDS